MPPAHMRNIAFVCLVVVLGGCSLADKDPSESQFCLEVARRECTAVVGKCIVVQQADCENVRRSACEAWVQRTKAGRAYQADRSEDCLKRVTAAYAKSVLSATELDDLQSECARVFGGNVADRGACVADVDCSPGLSCDRSVCASRRTVAMNGGCSNPGEVCPTTQYCAPQMGFSACTGRRDRGQPCSATEPCRESLRCMGTCVEGVATGTRCTPRADGRLWGGNSDECATGYCDPYARLCAPGLLFGGDSSSCRAYAGQTVMPASDGGASD